MRTAVKKSLCVKSLSLALFTVLALSMNGCSMMLTDYQRPELPQAASFEHAESFLGTAVAEKYWQLFGDEKLNALAERALLANYDLQNAYLNVRSAQAQLGLTNTNLNPTASASAGADVRKELDNGDNSKSSSTALQLSYEADLFGRLAAQRRSAAESLNASAYDYWAMRLSVISALGTAYWQYAYAVEALRLGYEELDASTRRLQLISAKYQAGAADGLEYDTAKVNHLSVMDSVEQRRQNLYMAKNALNLLLNNTPDAQPEIAALDSAVMPKISLVMPSELLSRRPDLMAAEARLRAAVADTDEARLNFYPQFNLTAGLTAGDGSAIARFLSDPIGALGAAVTFPFLNFNELSYMEDSTMVEKDRAELNFVNTYLTALQETADAIDAVNYYQQAVKTMAERERLAKLNYQRYEVRYRSGACPLSDLLDASDTLRQASISLLEAKRDSLTCMLNLMTAAGGDTSETHIAEVLSTSKS